jgi:ATP-binding cassette subfamily A (ABC1) protein 3
LTAFLTCHFVPQVNGAGKTTILGVLTGDVFATGGQAYVGGHDVTGASPGGVAAARKKIGYCPQVDPLLDLLTGRETLRMFGRLRGIPEDRLEATVTDLLARLTLIPYADKVTDAYSGGNKRKLSLGIALIGNPRVLLIDEASSGMDPQTRRKTWTLIEEAAKTRSVVLTSHSMEEVEALCSRVGIMVKGQFICLGSIQHLKTKFLDGYSVSIGFEAGTPQFEIDHVLSTILSEVIPGSTLSEQHGRFLRFDVPSASCLGLGTMFRKFQGLKDSTSLETYSISQCTLEQVFIKLVKSGQVEPSEQENDNL